ncbi:hypothetical protein [uncultured Legionella sp.]|uniref:hypothetical protein n=1 Tax=uncultured Legionella sp. TaxID=210934 RepID=UPI00261D3069|nr:hypothetical protein [uncultured Legionella sp.]
MIVLILVFVVLAYVTFFTEYADEQNNETNFDLSQNKTEYNPATGLPMIGALDSMGNSIGSSAFDHNSWNSDYHYSTYNSSSYDSFSNRY